MQTEREIAIYIADDHPIVVDGLKEILKAKKNWVVKGTAYDGLQLLELIKKEPVDVVILDINMPHLDGIQAARWIKENRPGIKVIILTMYPEKTYIEQLIKVGADGCLLKSRGTNDLIEAIERVTHGLSYFDSITDFKKEPARSYKLSDREFEIIRLVIHGKSSIEIAEALCISEDTVKTHRKNIFRKLNIHHANELMTIAVNNGWA
jgi:DNA-binding NarL/FixJ family response regulator